MRLFSLSRWRPGHLLLSWVVYWIALLAAALGPAVPSILRATRPGGHGEIAASFNDTVFSFVVKESGRTTWSGSVHMLTAALWIAVPPLIIWMLWLYTRGAAARRPSFSEAGRR